MAQELEVIRFQNSALFSGLTGTVDFKDNTIHGVSLITGQSSAEGHDLWIDGVTLNQLHALGSKMVQIPVTLDHGGGITSINGYVDNVRLDNQKWRGDWHLLKSHKETETMLERAERQPSTFGMSVAFKGPPKGVLCEGKQCARAERLLSVDCVTRPAANADGLFGAKDSPTVDTLDKSVMQNPGDKEPTLKEVMEAIESIKTDFNQLREIQDQVVDHLNGQAEQGAQETQGADDRQILEALFNASDEELASHGLTRDEVNAAVNEYNTSVDGGQEQGASEGQHSQEQGANGSAEMAGAATGAGVDSGPPNTFGAVASRLVQLEAKLAAKERAETQAAEAFQFEEVEGKIVTLAEQNVQLKEFAANTVAENEALRTHLRTGTRPVKAGVDEGVRLFSTNENGELHAFQQLVKNIASEKKVSEGQAIQFAMKEPNGPALHADWLQNQRPSTIHA